MKHEDERTRLKAQGKNTQHKQGNSPLLHVGKVNAKPYGGQKGYLFQTSTDLSPLHTLPWGAGSKLLPFTLQFQMFCKKRKQNKAEGEHS